MLNVRFNQTPSALHIPANKKFRKGIIKAKMRQSRLGLIDKELEEALLTASISQLQAVIEACVRFSLFEAKLQNPLTLRALEALSNRKYSDSELIKEAEALFEKLDIKALKLRASKSYHNNKEPYKVIFKKARAASAIVYAFNEDLQKAALQTVYETNFTTDYPSMEISENLRRLVLSILTTDSTLH